jgi:hypothetical protein
VSLAHLAWFPCSEPFRPELLDAVQDVDTRAAELLSVATTIADETALLAVAAAPSPALAI